jgi:hypothetical protein
LLKLLARFLSKIFTVGLPIPVTVPHLFEKRYITSRRL